MRVAHISDCYLPRTGGIELQVRGLSQAQLAAGESPEIITATPAARGKAQIPGETDNGVPIHRLAVDLPAGLPISPYFGGRLRDLLLDTADVVHVHGGLVSVFAWPALRTAVKAGLPAVVSVHSVWAGWSRAFAAADLVSHWRQWPVLWTAVSDVAADPLRKALGGHGEVRVLHNGIDLDGWRPPPTTNPDPDEIVIVSVARLAVRKRGLALIDILERARAKIPAGQKVRAVLIGDGPDRSRIERTLERRNMQWVECVGWQDHDQIRAHYERASIYISPSRLESFGIAALEARTYGLPVIALEDSGTNEFIHDGVEGLLEPDDEGLVDAIYRLSTDSLLRNRIAEHNRTIEPAFGWKSIVSKANDCYTAAEQLRAASRT
ncbi:MAG TPA: glycosyl transferase [Actinobacteria bacterium]|nr:glycosyl transferase [Actinomycetota bacterium]